MRCIRRWSVPGDDRPHSFPVTGPVLAVDNGEILGSVDFWFEYDPDRPEIMCWFQVYGTGHHLPAGARYIGTCPRTPLKLVLHLYERPDYPGGSPGKEGEKA